MRRRLGEGWIGGLMDCFNCLSLWIAAPAALFVSTAPLTWLVSWLSVSGGACLLERLGGATSTECAKVHEVTIAAGLDGHSR